MTRSLSSDSLSDSSSQIHLDRSKSVNATNINANQRRGQLKRKFSEISSPDLPPEKIRRTKSSTIRDEKGRTTTTRGRGRGRVRGRGKKKDRQESSTNDYSESSSAAECSASDIDNQRDDRSFIDKLFQGLLVSSITCSGCKKISKKEEPFMDLSLTIESESSVMESLVRFVTPEKYHLVSSHLISSYLISSYLISSHLISSHLISSSTISSYRHSHLLSLKERFTLHFI
jgi:hypothetical protein